MSLIKNLIYSLRVKIAFILFFVIFLFLLLLVLFIRTTVTHNIQSNTVKSIYNQQVQMDKGLTLVLDSISLIYNPIIEDPNFKNLFESDNVSIKTELFSNFISSYTINQTIFEDIILYHDGHYYYGGLSGKQVVITDNIFGLTVANSNDLIVEGPVTQNGEDKILLFGKPFRKFVVNETGGLIFAIKEDAFNNILDSIDQSLGYSFLVSNQSRMISHPNSDYIGSIIFGIDALDFSKTPSYQIQNFDGQKSIIIINGTDTLLRQYGLDWTVVSVLSYDYVFHGLYIVNISNTIIAGVMTLISFVLALIISSGLIGPIKSLKKRVTTASLHADVIEERGDEIYELEKSFNEMLLRISELIDKNEEESENKRKLELYALQMQINPHFLYNTLDAIAWLAKLKKQPEIERLVIALAKFFRLSLHKGDKFIKVYEEIDIVKNFIEIELIRFPDKFDVEYNIDESTKHYETMKLILQPIVENSIKHGISGMDTKGHITINSYCDEDFIYYQVIDDGLGFDPKSNLLNSKKISTSSGYGIKNVDERIKLEYGFDCGVSVDSKPHGGTKVTIKILKRD